MRPANYLLSDIAAFSRILIGVPLYPYQVEALRAVIDSVLNRRGREFLLVFPRQSGKNEAIAHLLVYLLTVFQRHGGQIVYGAVGDGLGRGMRRLEERLDTPWTRGRWRRSGRPRRYTLGRASVVFISSHPGAAARGETADHLLILDEAQAHDPAHVEAVFTPMRAARRATAVYLGTVHTTADFLWAKKTELEAAQALDGVRRVFLVGPEQVTAANPDYAAFLAEQVRRYGRHHPIVAAEYFLEPLDGAGGLFPPWRLALMRGDHARQRAPRPGELYVAAIDPAGGDPAAAEPGAPLDNPGRDFTVATIFRLRQSAHAGPIYEALDVFTDHGSRHFQSAPGQTALAERLLAWLRHWEAAHVIIDAAGVGQGLADWLAERYGRARLTPFPIGSAAVKARLGSDFLALIDTGRFRYWAGDADEPLSDGWWFWQQAAACAYTLGPGGRFDHDLRWAVPDSARAATPLGPQAVHDDRLLSAALVAEIERRRAGGRLLLGASVSRVVGPGEF
ncbi:MAG: hypothetical protein M9896_15995 [Candidatus Promineofilum sp.]|uniref:hypothetical protein n=1 Tax=Promineifilum sp. TaxID=2664178 RepID=UPI002411F912|nr:hypothetical protein [Promineifilum sp.]